MHRCVVCAHPATQVHHRLPRGMGGTRRAVDASWGLALCTAHHDGIESHRVDAREAGWLLPTGAREPSLVPCWSAVEGVWRLLDPDGTWRLGDDADPPTAHALLDCR